MTLVQIFDELFSLNNQEYLNLLFNTSFHHIDILDEDYNDVNSTLEEKYFYVKNHLDFTSCSNFYTSLNELELNDVRDYIVKIFNNYLRKVYHYWVLEYLDKTFLIESFIDYKINLVFLNKILKKINFIVFGPYSKDIPILTGKERKELLDKLHIVTDVKNIWIEKVNRNGLKYKENILSIDGVEYSLLDRKLIEIVL